MDPKVVLYAIYLPISIALTIWVGRTLFRSGQVFLDEAFGDERLAAAVNRLLVVGFYLLNLGYVTVAMRDRSGVYGAAGVMEELSVKVGYVLLVLGVVHLFNLFALGRYRRSRLAEHRGAPPLPPTGVLPRTPQPYDIAWANYHAAVAQAQAQANKSGRAVAVPPAPGQPADGGEHDWAEPA